MKKLVLSFLIFALLAACEKPVEPENVTPTPTATVTTPAPQPADYANLDNKGVGWGIKKNKGAAPDVPAAANTIFEKYNTVYMDHKNPKSIYLTFDEGYENGYTGQILDTLKKCNVPAAFFITGAYLDTEKPLIERMLAEGHIVGNHTVNHPNLPKLESAEKMADELNALSEEFYATYGVEMEYMRPPEGEFSERLLAVANDLGYKTVFWSFAYKDWDRNQQNGKEFALSQVTPYLHDGAILLLHAVSKDNADALEEIITYARAQGYEFASLDKL